MCTAAFFKVGVWGTKDEGRLQPKIEDEITVLPMFYMKRVFSFKYSQYSMLAFLVTLTIPLPV